MTRRRSQRCSSAPNGTCRLLWPLRADSSVTSSFDVAAGLSGKTFTSESTYQAEMLSCCKPYSGKGEKQISQRRSFLMIGYLMPVVALFLRPHELDLPPRRRRLDHHHGQSSEWIQPHCDLD